MTKRRITLRVKSPNEGRREVEEYKAGLNSSDCASSSGNLNQY
ncbi:MAG: hypothetical protein WCR01_03495 [Bacteroidota bacterium]